MSELKIFENPEFGNIRAIEINGEPWMVGKDVAAALGYTDLTHSITDHVDEEDRINSKTQGQNAPEFGQRGTWLINESGLYSLVLSSKLPGAKKFKRWVTSEVLPSIRKTGGYIAGQESLSDDELLEKALLVAHRRIAQREKEIAKLQAKEAINKPKVVFADAVVTSKSSILVGDLAKILKQNGVDIGQNRLFKWLRKNHYLCSNGERYNMPSQSSMEAGLFEIKETTTVNPDGSIRVCKVSKGTGKGQVFFINKFMRLEGLEK